MPFLALLIAAALTGATADPTGDPVAPRGAPAARPSARRLAPAAPARVDARTPARRETAFAAARHENVLVLLADDMGVETLGTYDTYGEPAAPTPWLDALAGHGVLFRNAYVEALCSATRSAMLTGKHPFRTRIGQGIPWGGNGGLVEGSVDEVSLADALSPTHRTFAVGKWHLTYDPALGGTGFAHPVLYGFDEHRGPISNLTHSSLTADVYYQFEKSVTDASGSTQFNQNAYATTDQVDDALDAIERAGDEPWFVWLAFNAPHKPYHVPPDDLVTMEVTPSSSGNDLHNAAIEAMDTEIGRLLRGIRPAVLARTWVVFVADNGSPVNSLETLPGPAKGTGAELGVHVPLIVAGPRVTTPGRATDVLVGATDLYATVCEMARVPVPDEAVDSVSFFVNLVDPAAVSRRTSVFSQVFRPNGNGPYTRNDKTVRDARYKLRVRAETLAVPNTTFVHLPTDPLGKEDLLPALGRQEQKAFDELSAELEGFGP